MDQPVLRIPVAAEVDRSHPLEAVGHNQLEEVVVVHKGSGREAARHSLGLEVGMVSGLAVEGRHMVHHNLDLEEDRSLGEVAGRSLAVDTAVDSLVVGSLLVGVDMVAVLHSHTGPEEAGHRVEGNMT